MGDRDLLRLFAREVGVDPTVGGAGNVQDALALSGGNQTGAGSPVGVVVPAVLGGVYTDNVAGTVWVATGPTVNDWAMSGGGGTVVVRQFPVTYNMPGLDVGVPFYVPTIGDILLDAWFEIDTAWDGTTPKGDIGTYLGGAVSGLFTYTNIPIDMTIPDEDIGVYVNADPPQGFLDSFGQSSQSSLTLAQAYWASGNAWQPRLIPARFTGAAPIQVVVSSTGQSGGGDPGAMQGAATVYLITATPV